MSLPKRLSRAAVLVFASLAAPVLAGCSFGPVYSGSAQSALTLAYAEPNSRLEQVFYQALKGKLGTTRDVAAPTLSASISMSDTKVGLSSVASPLKTRQVIATANWRVEQNGQTLSSGQRTAVAGYQTVGQAFADDEAEKNANEQAVRNAAEAVRLALLSELGGQ